jgi:hypothetical protein
MEAGNERNTDVDAEFRILQCVLLWDKTDSEENVRHKREIIRNNTFVVTESGL